MTKLLAALLTSSDLEILKLSYDCVKKQKGHNLQVTINIVVNTLNDDYYTEVQEHFKNVEVIRTESNGKPGKGHNSLLTLFKKNSEVYDYFLPLDGDDFLFPYSFSRIEQYMNYSPDILMMGFTDVLTYAFPQNKLHYVIDDKCYYCYNNFVDNMRSLWLKTKESPFKKDICQINSAGRLLLCSKKGLNIDFKFDENVRWYDDTHMFLGLFEQHTLNEQEYNIFMLNDKDIYLYNMLNTASVSSAFKKGNTEQKKKEEEQMFRKSVKNKFLAIREWDIHKMKFLEADTDEKFKVKDKIIFVENLVSKINHAVKIQIDPHAVIAREMFRRHAVEKNSPDMIEVYGRTK